MKGRTHGYAVDEQGMTVAADLDAAVDVLFDGRRIWSFHPARDAQGSGRHRLVPWPRVLLPRLDGRTEVALVAREEARDLFRDEVAFGTKDSRIEVVDAAGNPLAVDKAGRLQRTFTHTGDDLRGQIVDVVDRVLRDLREECGLDAYLAYGCLLGAVRDGHMIGHDSDADVSYLSRCTHPFDILRENTRVLRTMRRLGWQVVRMSGADFKVWVPLPDGRRCGVDIFGAFHIGGVFHAMGGTLVGDLDRSAVLPLGTVTLEGRELPAPGRPEDYLAFTYGPGWRVPDPAFHYDPDRALVHRVDMFFRTARRRYRFWHEFYGTGRGGEVPAEPSSFARWVDEQLDPGSRVFDLGSGTGRDAVWLAGQGHRVDAVDFTGNAHAAVTRLAKKKGVDVHHRQLNFENLAVVLTFGAKLSHRDHVRELYARGLLDTLGPTGRDNFWRFASMAQRRGGSTYLEFRTPASQHEKKFFGPHVRTYLDPAEVAAEIGRFGGRVTQQVVGRDLARLGFENPEVCRLVVRWSR